MTSCYLTSDCPSKKSTHPLSTALVLIAVTHSGNDNSLFARLLLFKGQIVGQIYIREFEILNFWNLVANPLPSIPGWSPKRKIHQQTLDSIPGAALPGLSCSRLQFPHFLFRFVDWGQVTDLAVAWHSIATFTVSFGSLSICTEKRSAASGWIWAEFWMLTGVKKLSSAYKSPP